jgi:hypothetical protein
MTQLTELTEVAASSPSPESPSGVRTVLQRTGLQPLRFRGRVLRFLDVGAAPTWERIRLALHARDDDTYVSEIYCRPLARRGQARAWCHASVSTTLSRALNIFERAVPLPENVDGAASCATDDIGVLCALIRLRREGAQMHEFRLAVGRFLFQMCMEPPLAGHDSSPAD